MRSHWRSLSAIVFAALITSAPLAAQDDLCAGAWKGSRLPVAGNVLAMAAEGGRLFAAVQDSGLYVLESPDSESVYTWRKINVGPGRLFSTRVSDLAIVDGGLWVATLNAGLNIMDLETGTWSVRNTANSSIPSNMVHRIAPVSSGSAFRVWLATGGGAALLRRVLVVGGGSGETWTVVGRAQGLPAGARDVAEYTAAGRTEVFVTDFANVYRINEGRVVLAVPITNAGECRMQTASRIAIDGSTTWFGAMAADPDGAVPWGPCRYTGGRFTFWADYRDELALGSRWIRDFSLDPDNRMWMGFYGGIAVHDRGTFCRFTPANSSIFDDDVQAIEAVGDGLWIGFGGGADVMSFFSPDWRSHANTDTGAAANQLMRTVFLEPGVAWVGLPSAIARLDESGWTRYAIPSDGSIMVDAITRDAQGLLWLGTSQGLISFEEEDLHFRFQSDEAVSGRVEAFASDSQGRLWVASGAGLSLRASGYWINFNHSNSGISGPFGVRGLAIDSLDRVWVATVGGVDVLDPESGEWTHVDALDAFFEDGAGDLDIDPLGRVWAVGYGGAARLDESGEWSLFDSSTGALPDDRADEVSADPVGRVWIGTRRGLALFANDSWIHLDPINSGLTTKIVNILEADADEAWAGTRSARLNVRVPVDSPIGHRVPTITSISPIEAAPRTLVTITGSGFDAANPARNIVTFGPSKAGLFNSATPPEEAEIISATPTALVVRLPDHATTGAVRIVSHDLAAVSSATFRVAPKIVDIEPDCLGVGDEIVLQGLGFRGVVVGLPEIRVGSGDWRPADSATPYRATSRLMPGDTPGHVTVRLDNGARHVSSGVIRVGSLSVTGHRVQQAVDYDVQLIWGKRTLVHLDVSANTCDTRLTEGTLYWKKKDGSRILGSPAYLPGASGVAVPVDRDGDVLDVDSGIDFVAEFYLNANAELFPLAEFDGVEIVLENGSQEVARHEIPAAAFNYRDVGSPLKIVLQAVMSSDAIDGTSSSEFWANAWESMAHVARMFPQQDADWRYGANRWISAMASYHRRGMTDLGNDDQYHDVIDTVDDSLDLEDNEIGMALLDPALRPQGAQVLGRAPLDSLGCTGSAFNEPGKAGFIVAHEGGHLVGLVEEDAVNHDSANEDHSLYDEGGDGNLCIDNLTFRRSLQDQLGSIGEHYSLGGGAPLEFSGLPCYEPRARSVMAYAPGPTDVNGLFEPVDYKALFGVIQELGPRGGTIAGAQRFLRIRGRASIDGSVEITSTRVESEGRSSMGLRGASFEVRILGEDDFFLYSLPFEPSFRSSAGETTRAPIILRVPFPADAERVEITRLGQAVWSKRVSENTPTIRITSPREGRAFNRPSTIQVSWDAGDVDGDELSFAIEQSVDGSDWERLAAKVTGTSWDWAPELRRGGDKVRVRVRASDGFNTAVAVSEPFIVEGMEPIPFILTPGVGSVLCEGQLLTLGGGAIGADARATYRWRIDGELIPERGARVHTRVGEPGTHRVELVVRQREDEVVTTREIEVLADYDGDGMPNDWELEFGLSPLDPDDTVADPDGDRLSNLSECRRGTDPREPDSDGDGASDGEEVAAGGNPRDGSSTLSRKPILRVGTRAIAFSWRIDMVDRDPPDPIRTWVTNSGGASLEWTATTSAGWLELSRRGGEAPSPVDFIVDHEALGVGVHTATVTFEAPDAERSTWIVDVTVEVEDVPGEVEPPATAFKRGDSNADGSFDVSDSVFTLVWLFLGGEEPTCVKASDVDDNGEVEITDALAGLRHLFGGFRRPPEPFAACGEDPTPDELACERFDPCE